MEGVERYQVRLLPHNPAWDAEYEDVRKTLARVFPDALAIEHVGSTAVPGIHAKPILDVAVRVPSFDTLPVDAMTALGYEYTGESGVPGRRLFVLRDGTRSLRHIHVYDTAAPFCAQVRFRELLRKYPAEACAYDALKADLAARYPDDRVQYTAAKEPFILGLLARHHDDAPDWYRYGWSLDAKQASWTEDTVRQVDFVVQTLALKPGMRVLDLACGYGRHALELARRGYSVVGVDLTPDFITDAQENARREQLDASFILSDIRDVSYTDEFDAVLNMADGAVGYLEDDTENLRIFDNIARALKSGGRHFLDVCSAEHAARYFPKRWWECGRQSLALAVFEWNAETHRMLYSGTDIPYGQPLTIPDVVPAHPTRLYTREELADIYHARGMTLERTFCDYTGRPATVEELQLLCCARKL